MELIKLEPKIDAGVEREREKNKWQQATKLHFSRLHFGSFGAAFYFALHNTHHGTFSNTYIYYGFCISVVELTKLS